MINTDCEVIGVDNFSEEDYFGQIKFIKESLKKNFNNFSNNKHKFFENDYKIILKKLYEDKKKISFYYYDAGHSYEDHRDCLILAKDILADDCIILIDDIGRKEVYEGTMEGLKTYKNYEILDHVKTIHPRHPTFWNGYILIKLK